MSLEKLRERIKGLVPVKLLNEARKPRTAEEVAQKTNQAWLNDPTRKLIIDRLKVSQTQQEEAQV